MCNAWNHPANCTCGWGGQGYISGGTNAQNRLFSFWPDGIPPISATLSSLTIPNAICPVCGDSVFYYCNSYGSSVFFDELGPPWPKHPCTDNSKRNSPRPPAYLTTKNRPAIAKWQITGWEPFELSTFNEIDNQTFRLQLLSLTTEARIALYIRRTSITKHVEKVPVFANETTAFLRSLGNGKYIFSALTENITPIQFEAFDSRINLNNTLKNNPSANTRQPIKKPSTENQKKRKKPERQTILSLAFEKAKNTQ